MHRSRPAVAALLMVLPLTLSGCSGGDVDVEPGNVEVTPPDVDVDAPDVDAPDVDVPDVDAPDVDVPDVDVDVDTDDEPQETPDS